VREVMSTAGEARNIALREVVFAEFLLAWLRAMRSQRSRDQDQPTDQQDQHHHGIEQTRRLEIDMQVSDDASEDEQRSSHREQPSDGALAVPEKNADAEQHRQERDAKTAASPKAPVGAHDADLVRDEEASDASHRKTEQKDAETARCSADVADRTVVVVHGRKHSTS